MYLTEAADLNEFIYLKLVGFSSSGFFIKNSSYLVIGKIRYCSSVLNDIFQRLQY